MEKIKQFTFSALFSIMLVIPAALTVPRLATFDAPDSKPVLNGELTRSFEKYVDDEYALKTLSRNVWAAIGYKVFGEGRNGVLIGQSGWLFSDEEIDPVRNSEAVYSANLQAILDAQRELAAHHIKLVIAILPAKTRIYADYLGNDTQPSAAHQALYARIHEDLKKAGIASPELLPALRAASHEELVFLRTDTHWTPRGAEVTADALALFIKQQQWLDLNTKQFNTEVVTQKPHQGDLLNYLPLSPWFDFINPFTDAIEIRKTTAVSNEESGLDDSALFADASLPVTLVGSSYSANPLWNFAGALQQATGTELLNVAKEGQGPVKPMQAYLQSEDYRNAPPQVVIWEFPERYLLIDNLKPETNNSKS